MLTLLIGLVTLIQTSIYSHSITDVNGNTIPLSNYTGKKMLLVNIATGSDKVGQLAGLQQLQQQYGDSLVVIAFPSNSFGKEQRSDSEIKQFCHTVYSTNFIIATQNSVVGNGLQPVYHWMANISENGDTNILINGDFQKILFDKDGFIIGIYAPTVSPSDPSIINAILGN